MLSSASPARAVSLACTQNGSGASEATILGDSGERGDLTVGYRRKRPALGVRFNAYFFHPCPGHLRSITASLGDRRDSINFRADSVRLREARYRPIPRNVAVTVIGGRGRDLVGGHRGSDVLRGKRERDRIRGGRSSDVLRGGSGDDRLVGGKGRDSLAGGAGSDTLAARDGNPDIVACGTGKDRAVVDLADTTRGCEVVRR